LCDARGSHPHIAAVLGAVNIQLAFSIAEVRRKREPPLVNGKFGATKRGAVSQAREVIGKKHSISVLLNFKID
jgi:hypothetical protein